MATKFSKINDDFPPKWASYFHTGTDWLMTWELLVNLRKNPVNLGSTPTPFYVDPFIVHFCLELFTKSLIAYSDPKFNPKEYRHNTIKFIQNNKQVSPIFEKILNNPALKSLVTEYANTIDTKYGETYVSIEHGDTEMMMTLVYEMREEICKKTRLR